MICFFWQREYICKNFDGMSTEYSVIEKKLHKFIKKYFTNEIIRGIIFLLIITISLAFIALIIEHFLFLTPTRKIFLISIYSLFIFISIVYFVIKPLFGYIGIYNKLTYKQINKIIVNHFPQINDTLWNIIELENQSTPDYYSKELVLASINQKIKQIKPYNFTQAVHYKSNVRFLFILLGIIAFSTALTLLWPTMFKESAKRIVHYKSVYVKPSPYLYTILNSNLEVGKGDNFNLEVEVITDKNFDEVFIEFGNNIYLMKKTDENIYSYVFSNLNNDINFRFITNEYPSQFNTIHVLHKPLLQSFSINVNTPQYTETKNQTYQNVTELLVPEGSVYTLDFNTIYTDSIKISNQIADTIISSDINYSKQIKNHEALTVSLLNKNFTIHDIIKIDIKTIRDEYPGIVVEQIVDEEKFTRIFFRGIIEDDYGFDQLLFITQINGQIDSTFIIDINKNTYQQDFIYAYDFSRYKGSYDVIEYYFQISDNDKVNGSKSSRSELFTFRFPNDSQIDDYQDMEHENIESIITESMKLTRDIKEDMLDLQQKLINSDLENWERKELIKNISSKKQKLEDALKNMQERNKELTNYLKSFTKQDEELIEKQEQINKMLEEVMTDEMRELMDEFNKMMEKFNENKVPQLKERMDISLDDLQEQLDRNIEMLKKLKLEQELNQIQNSLEEQINKQDQILKQINEGKNPNELVDEQHNSKQEIKKLQQKYNELQDLNNELENSIDMMNFDNEFENIDDEFEKSIDSQQKNENEKSKESIQKNKQNMKDLSSMLDQMMEMAFAKQNSENLEDLMQILKNLVTFSFTQEDIILKTTQADFDSHILLEQKKAYQDFQIIKDSLYALAKREPAVDQVVNKEIVNIENNFRTIDSYISENEISRAKINQQVVLTSANELALFLSEVIKQLQQQMANSMPGTQNCQNPGGKNPNPSSSGQSMQSLQQSLQQQLEKMMQMMKDGASQSQMNGEFGKALARQEKLQSMMQKMINQGDVGSESRETLKEAEDLLNKIKEDLLRNNLSDRTIQRNQQILTRMLKAENAQTERDIDEQRQSETANEQLRSETAKYFENNGTNDKFEERLIKQKLILSKFYQQQYQKFIYSLDSIANE